MDNAEAPILFYMKMDPRAGEGEGGESGEGGGGAAGGGGGEGFQIPEKFLVKADDGQPDYLRSLEKVHGSYTELEKRVGAVGLPPKSATEYKLERYLPEGMEPDAERNGKLLGRFHAVGMTNRQVQEVFNAFGEQIGESAAGRRAAAEAAQAELKAKWGDDYDRNMAHNDLARRAYLDESMASRLKERGLDNDPLVLELLAVVGRDLTDDTLPSQMNPAEMDSIDSLRNSEAYRNRNHADHKATVAKVNAAYAAGYKARD